MFAPKIVERILKSAPPRARTSRAGGTEAPPDPEEPLVREREQQQQRALLVAEVVVGDQVEERPAVRVRAAGDALEVVQRERRLQVGQDVGRELRAAAEVLGLHVGNADADDAPVGVVGALQHRQVVVGHHARVRGPIGTLEAVADVPPAGAAAQPAAHRVLVDPVLGEREQPAVPQRAQRLDAAVLRRLVEVAGHPQGDGVPVERVGPRRIPPQPVLPLEADDHRAVGQACQRLGVLELLAGQRSSAGGAERADTDVGHLLQPAALVVSDAGGQPPPWSETKVSRAPSPLTDSPDRPPKRLSSDVRWSPPRYSSLPTRTSKGSCGSSGTGVLRTTMASPGGFSAMATTAASASGIKMVRALMRSRGSLWNALQVN